MLTPHTTALCADCSEEVAGAHDCKRKRRRRMSQLERAFFYEQRRQLIRAQAMKRRGRR